jgi:hypothetical protein
MKRMGRTGVTQDKVHWRALDDTIVKPRVPLKVRNLTR